MGIIPIALGVLIVVVAISIHNRKQSDKEITTIGTIRPTQTRRWEDSDFIQVYQDLVLR